MRLLLNLTLVPIIKFLVFTIFYLIKLPFNLIKGKNIKKFKLLKIKDGDTFQILSIENNQKLNLRLYGIDTPEKFNSNKLSVDLAKSNTFFKKLFKKNVTKEEMLEAGELATNYAKELLVEGEEYDIELLDTDKYGRSVGIFYVDDKIYNQEIVKDGYAKAYTNYMINPFMKLKYQWFQLKSSMNNNGLWESNKNLMKSL